MGHEANDFELHRTTAPSVDSLVTCQLEQTVVRKSCALFQPLSEPTCTYCRFRLTIRRFSSANHRSSSFVVSTQPTVVCLLQINGRILLPDLLAIIRLLLVRLLQINSRLAVFFFQTQSPSATSCSSASSRSAAVCGLLPDPLVVVRVPTSTRQSHKPLSFTGQYCLFQCVCVCDARKSHSSWHRHVCSHSLHEFDGFQPMSHALSRLSSFHSIRSSTSTSTLVPTHLRPLRRRALGAMHSMMESRLLVCLPPELTDKC